MTIPRPRLTVRRLMIAVALVGLMMGGLALLYRRREFALLKSGQFHQQASAHSRHKYIRTGQGRAVRRSFLGPRALFYQALGARWRTAADRPWLPFEADPPTPE